MCTYYSTYSSNTGVLSGHFFCCPFKVRLESLDESTETDTANLKTSAESKKLFAESFSTGEVSDDSDLPVLPNATCKLRAGCRVGWILLSTPRRI